MLNLEPIKERLNIAVELRSVSIEQLAIVTDDALALLAEIERLRACKTCAVFRKDCPECKEKEASREQQTDR